MGQQQLQVARRLSCIADYTRKDMSPPQRLPRVRKYSTPDPVTDSEIHPVDIRRFASMELVEEDAASGLELPPHSELMGFFDHCSKLIMCMLFPQVK